MRKIGIYSKSIEEHNIKFIKKLIDCIRKEISPKLFLHENLVDVPSIFNSDSDHVFSGDDLISSSVELLISFGGDGTLLDTVTMIKNSNIPILGINAGRLGFLANITQDDIISAVRVIRDQKFRIDERTVLR